MDTHEKPQVGRAILFSLAAMVAFFIVYMVVGFVVILVLGLLLQVPVVGTIITWLFHFRGDTPEIFAAILATVLAAQAVAWMIGRFCDLAATRRVTLKISGGILVVVAVLTIIAQIANKGSLLTGIAHLVAGLWMFFKE